MEKIICFHNGCQQEFEIDIREDARAKEIQCPRCSRFFFVRKIGGEIKSFSINIADMA